ncbi:MAG: dihydropteroate synthase [Rhodospirillales bacterium 20-64-7]|nr:MAG: dihydropteroate synthase [Rhodospirillales bacterium 20-64-7]HQT75507.1 dihydropteroate synthase [Rhodopila sp.]
MTPPPEGRIWAGLPLTRPLVMGILNVTPDSFSDGGQRTDADTAIRAGMQMAADGADIVDVGGESTRPGASVVPPEVEQARIVPVVRALAAAGVVVSVDTRNASTMRATLDAGARIINDISGLAHDPAAAPLVAERGCPVVLMHMRGTPATMNTLATYQDVLAEVRAELLDRLHAAIASGIRPDAIALDPGLGFAKHPEHSRAVLCRLAELATLGYPLLVGLSRKGFIGALSDEPAADRRLGGSLAAGLFAVLHGASILRVHDVRETVQAIRVWQSLAFCGTVSPSQIPGERDNHAGRSNKSA